MDDLRLLPGSLATGHSMGRLPAGGAAGEEVLHEGNARDSRGNRPVIGMWTVRGGMYCCCMASRAVVGRYVQGAYCADSPAGV